MNNFGDKHNRLELRLDLSAKNILPSSYSKQAMITFIFLIFYLYYILKNFSFLQILILNFKNKVSLLCKRIQHGSLENVYFLLNNL